MKKHKRNSLFFVARDRNIYIVLFMEFKQNHLIPVVELGRRAGLRSDAINRLMVLRVIEPDEFVSRGKTIQPLFLASRVPELLSAIKAHQSSLSGAVA
jgi:hypothetical protein